MMVLNWRTRLDGACAALLHATQGVEPDEWVRQSPCAQWNVAQVLDHSIQAQRLFASYVPGAGGDASEEMWNPFQPSGDLAGPVAQLSAAIEVTQDVWGQAAGDVVMDTPLPDTQWPVWMAASVVGMDMTVHAWDIATATRQTCPIDQEWARDLLSVAQAIAPQFRQLGLWAQAQLTTDDDAVSQLLAMMGRTHSRHTTAA